MMDTMVAIKGRTLLTAYQRDDQEVTKAYEYCQKIQSIYPSWNKWTIFFRSQFVKREGPRAELGMDNMIWVEDDKWDEDTDAENLEDGLYIVVSVHTFRFAIQKWTLVYSFHEWNIWWFSCFSELEWSAIFTSCILILEG